MNKQHIKELIKVSKGVIADGSLENGAIVAANSDKAVYPAASQDYRYVWIRDAAYVCMAADILGLPDIPERFFDWCLNRAEDFQKTGLFCNAYHVNGTLHGTLIPPDGPRVPRSLRDKCIDLIHFGTQFQPDQGGSLLLAIAHHVEHFNVGVSKFSELIEKTAMGICRSWKGSAFVLPCFDLWEERCVLPEHKGYHTYSLAMCIAGLRAAVKLAGKKKTWLQTEKEMSNTFTKMYSRNAGPLLRTYRAGRRAKGKTQKEDSLPDMSLLGLVYPSGILDPLDEKMAETVREIIGKNTTGNGGLLRYPGDLYCGGVRKGWVTLTGAGAWPLLSFWMSIYHCLCGDKPNAQKHFDWPLARLVGQAIPEQIFKDKSKPSITPLLWSHAMFVIAAKFLGHI